MQTATAGIGHNLPPSDGEILKNKLAENNAKVMKRAEALIVAADRVPAAIGDQETSDKITDLEKQITVCIRALDDGHGNEKKPYLELGRVVDAFFFDPKKTLEAAKKRVKMIQTKFLVDQEAVERKRRADIAAQENAAREVALQEAAKLEEAGKKSQADVVLEKAIRHDEDAAFFEDASAQRGVAVAASKGEMTGARTSLRYTTVAEIEDYEKIDLNLLKPYFKREDVQKALNTALKFKAATIAGVKVWEKPEATTR